MATITIWMICPEYILPTALIANLPNKNHPTVLMMVGPAVAVGTLHGRPILLVGPEMKRWVKPIYGIMERWPAFCFFFGSSAVFFFILNIAPSCSKIPKLQVVWE